MRQTSFHGKLDYKLLGLVVCLILFGLLMLSSASSVISFHEHNGNSYYYFLRQLIFTLLGGGLAWWLSKIDYQKFRRWAPGLLLVALLGLVVVLMPGFYVSAGATAKSWINIFGWFSIQPAEFAKLGLIIYLAMLFSQRKERAADWHYGFLPFVFLMLILSGLIMLQPDTGSLMILWVIGLTIFLAAGARWRQIALLVGAGILGLMLLVQISPYRIARFTAFLHPNEDKLGVAYHINQSLIAVGSGGFMGVGLGHSRQKFSYLPEVYSDSIFPVVAEEMGFVVCLAFVVLWALISYRIYRLSARAPDDFGRLLALGIMVWFGFQALANIASMLSLMPMTGITLPFVSYGGSSILANMCALGIVFNISRQTVR